MGNQILSLVEQDTNKQGQVHVKKSVINPIKYGYQPSLTFQKAGDSNSNILNKMKFEGRQTEFKTQNLSSFIKKSIGQQYHSEQQKDRMRIIKEVNEENYESYRKLQPIKNDLNSKNQKSSTSDSMKIDFHNPNENRSRLKSVQLDEGPIVINYVPIVSKMISILKPFESELALLDENKVKKIRMGKSGDIYKGQLNDVLLSLKKLKKPHGFGMLIKQNGSTLIGRFQNGLAQGYSVFIYHNGSYYKGKMSNSMANDSSGEFYSLEMTYVGGFEDNAFHGNCQQLGDDYYFKGEYENNLRKKGVLSWGVKLQKTKINKSEENKEDNNVKAQKYKENLSQQIKVPPIRDINSIPEYNFIYEGQFDIHQLFTGKGKLKDPQGMYIGQFYRGMKHGKGQYQYESQIKYIGDYEFDQRSGHGILMNCDNTISYQGEWKNGLPNGKGSSYDLKGRKTECEFINGLPSKTVTQN